MGKLKDITAQLKLIHKKPELLKGLGVNALWNLAVDLDNLDDSIIEEYLGECGIRESEPDYHRLAGMMRGLVKRL